MEFNVCIYSGMFSSGMKQTCSTMTYGLAAPQMRMLYRFTLPDKWNVASSLDTMLSTKPSVSICMKLQNYYRERKIRRDMLTTNPMQGKVLCCQIWGRRGERERERKSHEWALKFVLPLYILAELYPMAYITIQINFVSIDIHF